MPLANVLTEAKDPSAFVVTMALFFFMGWFIGFLFRRIPFFRWLMLGAFLVTVAQHPHLPIAWEFPAFYIFWGCVGAYLSPYRNKLFNGEGFGLSIPSASGAGSGFFRSLCYFIKQPFKALWWTVKHLIDLILLRIPIYLIRLAYWLKITIPMLGKPEGWMRLLRGIGTFFWLLVPWMVRAEWNRLFRGRDFGDTRSDEFKRRYDREKRKHERREEWRSRSLFNELEQFVKFSFRKERQDPFPDGTPNSEQWSRAQESAGRQENRQESHHRENDSGNSSSDGFWQEQRRNKEEQESQSSAEQERRQSAESSSSQQQKSQQSADAYWKRQRSESTQSGKQSEQSQKSSTRSSTPPPKKETSSAKAPEPTSRAFYEKHRSAFEESGWPSDPTEDRFGSGKSVYTILDIPTDADRKEIKKAKIRFARRYMPFTNLNHAIPVQARANAILAETNGAVDTLLKRKK